MTIQAGMRIKAPDNWSGPWREWIVVRRDYQTGGWIIRRADDGHEMWISEELADTLDTLTSPR